MTITTETRGAPVVRALSDLHWGAIIAGAVAAAALAFVLHSFAAAIGVSLSSTAPTWRDASFALILMSGLYLMMAALASYSFGAYVATRLMTPSAATGPEAEFRDSMHGLVVWALATLLTAVLAIAAAQATPRLAAPSSTSASTSIAGENLIAFDLDRLFRGDRRPQVNMDYTRAEAARILFTTASHRGMQAEDRTYLVRLVALMTGLPPADAEKRVDDVAAKAKENITRARKAGVILGFMIGAAALIGALAAWFVAAAAGRHRDGREALTPLWDWSRPVSRL